MKNESPSLYEKAVAEINILSKKISFSSVNNIHTVKELKMKLNLMPVAGICLSNLLGNLLIRDKPTDLFHVEIISNGSQYSTLTVKNSEGTIILSKDEILSSLSETGKLKCLLVKHKMQHAAYPSYFLIENSFDEK